MICAFAYIFVLTFVIARYQETVKRLQDAFEQQDYDRAKTLAIELQYWTSILNAIHEWHP